MSIVQVASLAGVSKSTVSRVINRSTGVSDEVVRAVQTAMDKIGYRPPARRRGPKPASRRGIRTGNIALLTLEYNAAELYRMPVFPTILHGVERGLAEIGLNLVLANLSQTESLPAVLASGQADGVLLLGKGDGMPDSLRSRLRTFPAVWLMREHSDDRGEFDHVFYDNNAVGALAAQYLIERRHRHMAYVNAFPMHSGFAQRGEAFVSAVRAAGRDVSMLVADSRSDHVEVGAHHQLVQQLVQRRHGNGRPPITGLFVATDAHLPELYHAMDAHQIRPGVDVQIISCDCETQFLSRVSPRPASIDINLQLVGSRGVQQLLWRMRHPEIVPRISILVQPVLVEPAERLSVPETRG